VKYAYPITAALLLAGTTATFALQSPGSAQTDATAAAGGVATSPPRPGAPMSFADLAAKLQPAVVNIATSQNVQVATQFNRATGEQRPITEEQEGGGSGFVISADGYIVTNNHVISGGPNGTAVDKVTVTFPDRSEYKATIVGRDETSDVAVLKIDAGKTLPFVEIGDTTHLRVGDWVVAIGNPLGLGSTVTAGIVSALQRNTGDGGAYDRFIQTDTAINKGNSGGPLFDLNGKVVGINNRLISPVGANIGINFAIPADSVRNVIASLRGGASVKRGYLGVAPAPVDEDFAAALGLPKNQGALIQEVMAGQAGAKAGLKSGDVVVRANGQEVRPDQTLTYIVANTSPGQRIPIEIIRDGKRMTIDTVVGTRPTEQQLASRKFNKQAQPGQDDQPSGSDEDGGVRTALGLSVKPITPDIARELGVEPSTKGLVILAVTPGSDAAKRGLQRGDMIVSANYKPTANSAALAAQVSAAKKEGRTAVLLEIRRQGDQGYMPVKMQS
jgi:serine protease Do